MAKLGSLVPLLILFLFLGGAAFIGYSIYAWSNELAERGKKKMEKKNIGFTKEGGLRVGVKEMQGEQYADKTQNVLVNVWNNAALPNYKSKLGWNSTQQQAEAKKSSSSSKGSSTPKPSVVAHTDKNVASSSGKLAAPAQQRPGARRTPSTPGGWD